ncbi:MAG TPA: hypothetical protein PKK26_13900 [Candidatus Wallbacteria bacterium]|nr:hypothetical protein [Candidatus Wallbacteria bacterium]
MTLLDMQEIKRIVNKTAARKRFYECFTVTTGAGNTPDIVTGAVLDGTDRRILNLTLTNTIASGTGNILVSYTAGTIAAEDGGALATFSEQSVINTVAP